MSVELITLLATIGVLIIVFTAFLVAVAADSKQREQDYDAMLTEYFSDLRRTPPRHVHRVQKIDIYDQDADGAA